MQLIPRNTKRLMNCDPDVLEHFKGGECNQYKETPNIFLPNVKLAKDYAEIK